jgi:hypothetical protein
LKIISKKSYKRSKMLLFNVLKVPLGVFRGEIGKSMGI